MAKNDGPTLRIVATCTNCVHEVSESYCVEDGNDVDTGHDVYCTHPAAQGGNRRRVGDTRWDTPTWCPLLASAKATLLASESRS